MTMGKGQLREHSERAASGDRRRHERHHLGLPIRVHFDNGVRSADIELADVSRSGGRFVGLPQAQPVRVGESIAFGFVLPGPVSCVAAARVVRVEAGAFAVQVDHANPAYESFVSAFDPTADRV